MCVSSLHQEKKLESAFPKTCTLITQYLIYKKADLTLFRGGTCAAGGGFVVWGFVSYFSSLLE